jgi:ACS family tartrate transporter-like MFS transporter
MSASVFDEESVRRSALRKASLRLLPLLGIGYSVSYIDRANVSFAALQMNHDLHFSASMYGLGAGLFFIGYAACEVPSNLLLLRFGARRWIARIMFTWGLLAIAMMFVRTPVQFYTLRFLLGMAEAGFFPGVIYYVAQWFPAAERARAVSRFYVAIPLSGAVMGAIAGALLNLQGRLGLAGWQWLFLVEGLPAVLLGVVFLFLLPDGPQRARWLTGEERDWIVNTLRQEDSVHTARHGENWLIVLRDKRFWYVATFLLCLLTCNYAFSLSAPVILQGLTGFTASKVGFLLTGINLLAAVAMIANARHSDRTMERYLHTGLPFLLVAAGFLVAGFSAAAWIAVPALAMTVIGSYAIIGPQWTLPPTFLRAEHAAPAFAALNTVGILGGFIGPYWMGIARDLTGSYRHGLATMTIPAFIAVVAAMALRREALAAKEKAAL